MHALLLPPAPLPRLLLAGGAVDPFWAMYQQHQKAEVKAMLEEYKIGELEGE